MRHHKPTAPLRLVTLLCMLSTPPLIVLSPGAAFAQADEAGSTSAEDMLHIVVLDVPLEGTETLAETIVSKRQDVALYPQTWFIDKINEVGFDPDGIIKRREQLSIVMEESNVDYIVLSQYSEKQSLYRFTVIPRKEDSPTHSFTVESFKEDGMTRGAAVLTHRQLFEYIDGRSASPTSNTEPEEDPLDPGDPNALRDAAIKAQQEKKNAGPKGIATFAAGFRLIEPTLIIITADSDVVNSLAITLGSTPGFAFQAELYPMKLSADPAKPSQPTENQFGLSIHYNQVFKSLNLQPDQEVPAGGVAPLPSPTRVSYLDFEAGAFYEIAIGSKEGGIARLRPKALFRLQRLGTSTPVVEFQPFRFISLAIGADVIFPLADTGANLLAGVELAPFTNLKPLPLDEIGTFRYAYTTSGSLGIDYKFLPNVGFQAQYMFDHTRLLFESFSPDPVNQPNLVTSPKGTFSAAGIFAGVNYTY